MLSSRNETITQGADNTMMRISCSCLALLGLFLTSIGQAAEKKNVLFLVADDLNCDLGCYQHQRVLTPNIDRLAKRGTLFERAYCQFPLCSPSRSSFLTGRRPNETQIVTNPRAGRVSTDYTGTPHFREFIPDTVTLPQLFKQQGYHVARVGKLYHYGVPGQIGTSGLDDLKSWQTVVNPAGRDKAEENKIFTFTPGNFGGTLSWHASAGDDLEHTDGLSATAAISLLEQYRNEPFFLAVGFYRPHTPYVAPQKYFDSYKPESVTLPALSRDDLDQTPAPAYQSQKKEQVNMTQPQRQTAMAAYWSSISFMDAQVGRVVDALDRLKLADSTIIIMTSDHGYHMYEHGLWQKMSLFENSAHVPLIVRLPGDERAGQRTTALCELVDLYPTLADLCELKAPDYIDGVSLKPVLQDPKAVVKEAAFTQLRRGNFDGYSIRTDRYRYTEWDGGRKGRQLFDMQKDPGESNNLADLEEHSELVKQFHSQLSQYAGTVGRAKLN